MKNKKTAIMQPYIFPYIGYWQLINAVDIFYILDDVNYIKKGWINRNNILMNGKSNLFTLPLVGVSQNKKINDSFILNEEKWKNKLLKTISNSYSKSPKFNNVFPLLEKIINNKEENLSKFLTNQIIEICRYLKINTEIRLTSSIKNQDLKGEQRIIDICLQNETDVYLNPIGGKELYNKNNFLNNNIELLFLESERTNYKQYKNDFIPWLSIIDILMFNSIDEVKVLLSKYSLA